MGDLDRQPGGAVVQLQFLPDQLLTTYQDYPDIQGLCGSDRSLDLHLGGVIAAHGIHSDGHHSRRGHLVGVPILRRLR